MFGNAPTLPGGSSTVPLDHIAAEAEAWRAWLGRFPAEAVESVQEVARWAGNFVEPLNLCPWAAASLAENGVSFFKD